MAEAARSRHPGSSASDWCVPGQRRIFTTPLAQRQFGHPVGQSRDSSWLLLATLLVLPYLARLTPVLGYCPSLSTDERPLTA